jgi:hypothetical protein
MGTWGDHAFSCKKTNQVLLDELSAHGAKTRKEIPVGLHDRMGDLVVDGWTVARPLYADISVVSSLCRSSIGIACASAHGATRKRSVEKRQKYGAELASRDLIFSPLSVSVLGAWNPEAPRVFKRLGGMIATASAGQIKKATSTLLTKVSYALQRSDGNALVTRYIEG